MKRPTCFISYSEYRPSSNPHALRIDHRCAQKSGNGAIYCRPPLLEHVSGKQSFSLGLRDVSSCLCTHHICLLTDTDVHTFK